MSRINYSEEEDFPGQFFLWQANCDRALAGRKGQAALQQLRRALLELPEKKLAHGRIARGEVVCAVGALMLDKRLTLGMAREAALAELNALYNPPCEECYHYGREHTAYQCTTCAGYVAEGKEYYSPAHPFQALPDDDDDDRDTSEMAAADGVAAPHLVLWKIVEMNDITYDRETEEERYEGIFRWVERHLKEPVPA